MSFIQLDRVCVSFPMYDLRHRSLKRTLLSVSSAGRIVRRDDSPPIIESLRELSLTIGEGERVALVGPNGAGKTTLLRVLAGVYQPVSGVARMEGTVTSLLDPTFGMNMESTGWENIDLRALYLGLDRKASQRFSDDVAQFCDLGDFLDMPVRVYSAGMLLRLAFAMSTTVNPDILLMDEWLSAGDAAFMIKAQRRMEDLVRNARILVIATHDTSLVESLCTRVVALEGGVVVRDDTINRANAMSVQ